jgi:hypothetical protein
MQAAKDAASKGATKVQLSDCFAKFLEREQLGENNMWYCPSCKEHKQVQQTFLYHSISGSAIPATIASTACDAHYQAM